MEDEKKKGLHLAIPRPNNLEHVRVDLGITPAELERESRVTRQTISDIEKGKRQGKPEIRSKILRALITLGKKEISRDEVFP